MAIVSERESIHSAAARQPFDPRTEVSADAQYLLRNLLIWFWILPVVFGVIGVFLVAITR